jgi:hypothetical protein
MGLIPLGILSSAGSGFGTYELIQTTILGSSTASVTFSGLDAYAGIYKHLQIRYTARSDDNSQTMFATFNGVTGTSYATHRLYGYLGSVISDAFTSRANLFVGGNAPNTNVANSFTAGVIDITDFASTTKNTTTRALGGFVGAVSIVMLHSGLFNNTAAVTSVSIFGNLGNLVTGSRFSIYGIR